MEVDTAPTPEPRCPECGRASGLGLADGLCPVCLVAGLDLPDVGGEVGDARERAFASPLEVPGYTVGEEVARGGMGIVYRAWQLAPSRMVAMKMLLPVSAVSTELRERFRLEAQTLSELDHPGILPIYETGEHEGLPWFSMKYAGGGSLAERIRDWVGRWEDIAELMARLADAVQFAHERGVLHRDLKPANILFDAEGRPFVADFGLAKLVRQDLDVTGSHRALGTPHYLAPEIAATHAGRATTASDVYGLGALLFELLTGRPPFEAEGLPALLKRIVEEEPVLSSPAVPRDLRVIVLKCLAKVPHRRYGSARELADELRRFLAGEPILAREAGLLERWVRWSRRQPALAAAVAGILILLAGLAIVSRLSTRRIERLRHQGLARLYASDMRLAQQAIAESKFGVAAALLERHRPARGDPDWRGFEWWHFRERCRSDEVAAYGSQTSQIQRVVFSADGRFLATGGSEVQIWEAKTRRLRFRYDVSDFVWALAFSPDGMRLGVGTSHGSVLLFETDEAPRFGMVLNDLGSRPVALAWGRESWPLSIVLQQGWAEWDGASAGATRLAGVEGPFSRARTTLDGLHVAMLSGSLKVQCWRMDPRRHELTLPLTELTRALDVSPDGRRLALGEFSGGLRLMEAKEGGHSESVRAHRGLIECVAFSPDGSRVASAGVDQVIRVHDAVTGVRQGEWQGHRGTVLSLAWSPDGRWLVSGDKLGQVKLWDVSAAPSRSGEAAEKRMTLSVDGGSVAGWTSSTSLVWRAVEDSSRAKERIPTPASWLVLPGARGLAAVDPEGGLHAWEAGGGWRQVPLGDRFAEADGALSPDGRFVALRVRGVAGPLLWDLATGREHLRITNEPTWLHATFSGNSRRLSFGSAGGMVQVWDVPSGTAVAAFQAHGNYAYDCDLSADGTRLATAGFDGAVRLWEVATARRLGEYRSTGDAYWTVALSPDGRRIAAGTSESSVVMWDARTEMEVATFQLGEPFFPVEGRLRFSPDGSALLRVNGVLNQWRAPTGAGDP